MVDPDVAFSEIRTEDSWNCMLIQLPPEHASEAQSTSPASAPAVVILVF
jgi:hypothetical protein